MGQGAARIDQEMLGRMARRTFDKHYGSTDSGPKFPPITAVTLHGFGDASKIGVSATVYAVVQQGNNTTQGLVCSKSRLAKKNLSIPRLELVAAHMTSNLALNVECSIDTVKVSSVYCWIDSTVALYWLNGQGEYQQFVSNRVAKIKERDHIHWHHIPTEDNPADIRSRALSFTISGGSARHNL